MGMKIPFTSYIVMFTLIDYPFFRDIRRLPVKNLNNCYTTWSLITANFLNNLMFY